MLKARLNRRWAWRTAYFQFILPAKLTRNTLLIGIINFAHYFNRNIVIFVVSNNSVEFKRLTSDKVNESSGVIGGYFSNGIIERNVEEV